MADPSGGRGGGGSCFRGATVGAKPGVPWPASDASYQPVGSQTPPSDN